MFKCLRTNSEYILNNESETRKVYYFIQILKIKKTITINK